MNTRIGYGMVLLLSWFTNTAQAQYIEPDSAYTGPKKSLFLLANPIFPPLMGSTDGSAHLALSYKRVLSNTKRLKFGAFFDYYNLSPSVRTIDPSDVLGKTDSSVSINVRQEYYRRVATRGGLEWGDYNEKHGKFYGVDLIAGYSKNDHQSYNNTYVKEWAPDSSFSSYALLPDSMAGVYDYTHHYLTLGFAANIGYRVVIKQKWELNFTFSPEFTFNLPVGNQWNLTTPAPLQYEPTNSFEMQLRMLLIDIGYRF